MFTAYVVLDVHSSSGVLDARRSRSLDAAELLLFGGRQSLLRRIARWSVSKNGVLLGGATGA